MLLLDAATAYNAWPLARHRHAVRGSPILANFVREEFERQRRDLRRRSVEGCTFKVTLDVGREPGTWMPEAWAASGARLSLPMRVTFANDFADVGMVRDTFIDQPARRVLSSGGSFVGRQGEVIRPRLERACR